MKSLQVHLKANNEDDFSRGDPFLGADPLYTTTQVATWQAARKVAVEPVFDLLSKLLSITGAHKPLPLRGVAYVSTFLGIGIMLLQLAML